MFSIVSCDPARKYEKREKAEIQDYLASNPSLNFVLQSSGLYYLGITTGTGSMPVLGDSAWVLYRASFLNGTVFDSTSVTTGPYAFIVGTSISGFDQGVMMMNAGGQSKLLVPSSLAYGASGNYYGIAGYTPLLFDVILLRIKPYVVK
jgi:peptidylprolyl isomerase